MFVSETQREGQEAPRNPTDPERSAVFSVLTAFSVSMETNVQLQMKENLMHPVHQRPGPHRDQDQGLTETRTSQRPGPGLHRDQDQDLRDQDRTHCWVWSNI